MAMLLALGVSIGVLIAGWTYVALAVAALPVWAGIIAWGTFFAAGGKVDGLIRTVASNLSGVFWAFVALFVAGRIGGGTPVLAVMVGLVAFMMVVQSRIPQLSFIPGAFLGAATTVGVVVGANGTYPRTILALIAGAVLGFISELLANALVKAMRREPAPRAA